MKNSNIMCIHCSRPVYLHYIRGGLYLCSSVANIFLSDSSTRGRAMTAFLNLLDEVGEIAKQENGIESGKLMKMIETSVGVTVTLYFNDVAQAGCQKRVAKGSSES